VAVASSPTASHKAMERFIQELSASPLVEEISMRPLTYERKRGASDNLEFSILAEMLAVENDDMEPIVAVRPENVP